MFMPGILVKMNLVSMTIVNSYYGCADYRFVWVRKKSWIIPFDLRASDSDTLQHINPSSENRKP